MLKATILGSLKAGYHMYSLQRNIGVGRAKALVEAASQAKNAITGKAYHAELGQSWPGADQRGYFGIPIKTGFWQAIDQQGYFVATETVGPFQSTTTKIGGPIQGQRFVSLKDAEQVDLEVGPFLATAQKLLTGRVIDWLKGK